MVSVVSHKRSPEHKALFRRVDEVLHYVWDPIGVAGTPEARDEYDSYASQVFSLLIREAPAEEISLYLVTVETEAMGLSPAEGARERADKVVHLLQRWRDSIREQPATI
jgi:aconitase B